MNPKQQESLPQARNQPDASPAARPVVEPGRIRAQLELVLDSPPFRNSKRYPALLRHVVERTLDGESAGLKERTLAIDVFGRDTDYDPAADPVVRTSAGEVRKRLAQYYQLPEHAAELRIVLPLGAYIPEFREAESAPVEPPVSLPVHGRPPAWLATVLLAAILCALAAMGWRWLRPANTLDAFWQPVVAPGGSILVCVGEALSMRGSEAAGKFSAIRGAVAWSDALTLVKVSNLLQARGASPQACREDMASFDDFQQGPAVLIGGLNDEWTLRLMQNMRFQVRREGDLLFVSDLKNPQSRQWSVDARPKGPDGRLELRRDYAVISRVANPRTGRMTVMLAGLWASGTVAAGQFATDSRYLQALSQGAPANWEHLNLQAVIETEVIDHTSGPPRIIATHYW